MNRRERLLAAVPGARPSARLAAPKAAPGGFVMTTRASVSASAAAGAWPRRAEQ